MPREAVAHRLGAEGGHRLRIPDLNLLDEIARLGAPDDLEVTVSPAGVGDHQVAVDDRLRRQQALLGQVMDDVASRQDHANARAGLKRMSHTAAGAVRGQGRRRRRACSNTVVRGDTNPPGARRLADGVTRLLQPMPNGHPAVGNGHAAVTIGHAGV
jgi:hypothetical protein